MQTTCGGSLRERSATVPLGNYTAFRKYYYLAVNVNRNLIVVVVVVVVVMMIIFSFLISIY